jgi:hypothetical protein
MKDFIERLSTELRTASAVEGAHRRRRARRRRAAVRLAAATAACLAVVAAVLLSSGSAPDRAQAFAVLRRPPIDARGIDIAKELAQRGADLRNARAIHTDSGRALVLPRKAGGLCLAVPDGVVGFQRLCVGTEEAAAQGVSVFATPTARALQRNARQFVLVVPEGTAPPAVYRGGVRVKTLAIRQGVVAALVPPASTIKYRVARKAIVVHAGRARAGLPTLRTCKGRTGTYRVFGTRGQKAAPCG